MMRSILDLKVVPEKPPEKEVPAAMSAPASESAGSPWRKRPPVPKTAGGTAKPPVENEAPAAMKTEEPAAAKASRNVPVSEPIEPPLPKKEERRSVRVSVPADVPLPKTETTKTAEDPDSESGTAEDGEFELVFGRRQVASCLFAGTVILTVFTAGGYLAGKMSAPNCAAASSNLPALVRPMPAAAANSAALSAVPQPAQAADVPSFANPQTLAKPEAATPMAATSTPAPVALTPPATAGATTQAAAATAEPLFAEPKPGALYIQIGAVDHGMAGVIAEGLRQYGFHAFVAPGPNEKISRVLIGPFATQEEYASAKIRADAIYQNFPRQYAK